jgi:hypothetical protein
MYKNFHAFDGPNDSVDQFESTDLLGQPEGLYEIDE